MRLRLRRSDEQPPEQPTDDAVPAEEGLRQWQPRLYLKLILLLAVIAFAIAFLGTAALWWLYFDFVATLAERALERAERRTLLAEHGKMARDYPDVRANTVASFALGDYEWILAFEADDLTRIVDLMRHLRASETRRHVREEVPFYTGPRVEVAALVDSLP